MADTILKLQNISKQYRLGNVGTGTLRDDLKRWSYKIRGKEDPFLKVGEVNDRSSSGDSDYIWALKSISFEVNRGEVLGIIGKNGAGKSTLLKLLSRVTSPTTGTIKSKGRIASLLEVGTGFHPEMTGRENIFLNGAILGMTKSEIKAKEDEIIEFSGCQRYIDTPVKRYSSGMRVRLAFAVAAHLEPDILVVDEVLAVGDAEFQKKAIGKMQDISQGQGRTVLFVSHNMAAVKSLCTRVLVLIDGNINYEGSSEEAISFYLNRNEFSEMSNIKSWQAINAPSFDNVTLLKASIYDKSLGYSNVIKMDSVIVLEYVIKCDHLNRKIFANSQFIDETGRILFATTSKNTILENDSLSSGNLKLQMTIPSDFFNQGVFRINTKIVDGEKGVLIDEQQLLTFTVSPKPIKIGDWMGKSKGPLRPNFKWKKTVCND